MTPIAVPDLAAEPRRGSQRWLTVALLLGFALLVALRLPQTWKEGRFQDEEATVFLAFAWHFPAEALLRSFAGYLNLAANGITLGVAHAVRAGVLSLEQAPYVTMIAGLLAQLVPAALILANPAPWLRDTRTKAVALLLLVLLPATDEVFLNVLHIQFHLALAVALIMALDVTRGRIIRMAENAILILAPLCGPGAIVFLPLFALRALVDRDSRRWVQLAILGLGAAIQLLLFYETTDLRGVPFDPTTLAGSLFIRVLALPISGVNGADFFGWAAASSMFTDGRVLLLLALLSVGVFTTILVTTLQRRDSAFWLFAGAMSVAFLSLGFGIITGASYAQYFVLAGPRYNYIPQALIGLCFLCLATRGSPVERRTPRLLVAMMLFVGTVHYLQPFEAYARGPSWHRQVAKWRENPDHHLVVWPPNWAADLSNNSQRCESFRDSSNARIPPRYCYEGWLLAIKNWIGPKAPK